MKKYLGLIAILLVAEFFALLVGSAITYKIFSVNEGQYIPSEESSEPVTYTVLETYGDHNEPLFKLVHIPSGKVLKESVVKANEQFKMVIDQEVNHYAVVRDSLTCNVYDPDGNKIFDQDQPFELYNGKYLYFVHYGELIANSSNDKFYDLKGNEVNNFYTFCYRISNKLNPLSLFLVLFLPVIVLTLLVFVLWYFLLWKRFKQENTVTKTMRRINSLATLPLALMIPFTIIFFLVGKNVIGSDTMPGTNYLYDIGDLNNHGASRTYGSQLLYYDPQTNTNKVVRETTWDVDEEHAYDIMLRAGDYVIFDDMIFHEDRALENVYGPDGIQVFEQDKENSNLVFRGDKPWIVDINTGEYFDLKGQPVNNLATRINSFCNNEIAIVLTLVLLELIALAIWLIITLRRTKNKVIQQNYPPQI